MFFLNCYLSLIAGLILSSFGFYVAAEHWLRTATKINEEDDEETLLQFQKTRTKRHYEPLTSSLPVIIDFQSVAGHSQQQ